LANGIILPETSDTLFLSTPGNYSVSFQNVCGISQCGQFVVTQSFFTQTPSIAPSGLPTICEETTIGLNIIAQPGILTEWLFNGNVLPTGTQLIAPAQGIYTVRASGYCDTTVSDPVNARINALPPVLEIIPAGPTTLCAGDSVIPITDEAPGISFV